MPTTNRPFYKLLAEACSAGRKPLSSHGQPLLKTKVEARIGRRNRERALRRDRKRFARLLESAVESRIVFSSRTREGSPA